MARHSEVKSGREQGRTCGEEGLFCSIGYIPAYHTNATSTRAKKWAHAKCIGTAVMTATATMETLRAVDGSRDPGMRLVFSSSLITRITWRGSKAADISEGLIGIDPSVPV